MAEKCGDVPDILALSTKWLRSIVEHFVYSSLSDKEPKLQCISPDQTIHTFAQSGLGIVCICQKEVLSHLNICSL